MSNRVVVFGKRVGHFGFKGPRTLRGQRFQKEDQRHEDEEEKRAVRQ